MQKGHDYIFILGRYPEFSTLEITSVLKRNNIVADVTYQNDSFILVHTTEEIPVNNINALLGGTVKIGKVIHSIEKTSTTEALEQYFTSDSLFIDVFENINDKITFGISYYSDKEKDQAYRRLVPTLLKTIKGHLEAQGFTVRFPRHEGPALSSASVEKNKLLKLGAEILILQMNDLLVVGKTLAVQEFEAFSQRDYGRPERDMDSGIMPPKIARMMVNITDLPEESAIIDPFCGSGTLLQEALLLGFNHLTGSDISEKAVRDTQKNLEWLKDKLHLSNIPNVVQCDVTQLSSSFGKESFDGIVAEPFMGPNFQQKPTLQLMQKNKEELEKLYLAAYAEFAKVLKPQGIVVMILPIFHLNNQYLHMDVLEPIEKLGFEQIPLRNKKRKSLVIGNRYDFVLREIVKWRKK